MSLTPLQHAIRATGIGGSEAAAALGLSPWVTPWQLYTKKAEGADLPPIDPDAAEWGHLLENAVATKWSRVTGKPVVAMPITLRSPEHPFMVASLDRGIAPCEPVVGRIGEILECKTSGFLNPDEWGEDGSDEVPEHYVIQVVHYLIVTGAQMGHIAALFNGRTFRRYVIRRDPSLEEMVIEGEREFWRRVIDRDPPPITTLKDAAARYPRSTDQEIEATPEVAVALRELSRLRAARKEADEAIEAREVLIKAHMGEAAVLTVQGIARATWKSARPSTVLDTAALAAAHPDIYAAFQRERAGSRRFLTKE